MLCFVVLFCVVVWCCVLMCGGVLYCIVLLCGVMIQPQSQPEPYPILSHLTLPTLGTPSVIESKVDLQGPAYLALEEMRKTCTIADSYENPGKPLSNHAHIPILL